MAKKRRTKSKSKQNTKKKIVKRNAKTKRRAKKSSKIKVVSDLLTSSYGIGALSKKKVSQQSDMDSFLKGIDTNSSGSYDLKGKKKKKSFTPKPPKGKKPSKKSPKKRSKYQQFVSEKLKEYKSLDIPQPEKMKKAAAEWKKYKSA